MQRTIVYQSVALLAAVGMVLTACASDDDSSQDTERTADDSGGLFGTDGGGDDADVEPGAPRRPVDQDEPFADDPADGGSEEMSVEMSGDAADMMSSEATSSQVVPDDRSIAVGEATSGGATTAAAPRNSADSSDAEGGLFGAGEPPVEVDRQQGNTFEDYGYRDFVAAATDPLSTFALDVDTGSYSVARRWLDEGTLPPRESVRPEEYVNAFRYDYDEPRSGLELTIDGGPSPFEEGNLLVRIGVQGEVVDDRDREPAALTFVVDTSGSMDRDDRLGLVKTSLSILVEALDDDDTVAIVTYDDNSGVVLEPTSARDRDEILDAIDRLRPGGSTNLEAGLREGYALAGDAYRPDGVNRVVLASDGVANVGITDPEQLARMIRDDAGRGINLVTVGFGMGNFNDVTMEQLADRGDGFYAYVDTEDEAERLFEDELTSTLLTIAKDAKIQIEFDPEIVKSYRLIGFENRGVLDSEFRNDSIDAGDLGAGHQVTALYEIELERGVSLDDRGDIGEVFLRWEGPEDSEVIEIDDDIDLRDVGESWDETRSDFQLATVVAVFAELMRDNPYADDVDISDLIGEVDRLADELDDRAVDELADLIRHAASLR